MDEKEPLSYVWDFKKPIDSLIDYLEEHFPELTKRLISAWKINGTSWEVKFKRMNKDEL